MAVLKAIRRISLSAWRPDPKRSLRVMCPFSCFIRSLIRGVCRTKRGHGRAYRHSLTTKIPGFCGVSESTKQAPARRSFHRRAGVKPGTGRIDMELNTSGYGLTLGLTLCAGFVIAFIIEMFLPPKSRCPICMTLSRKKKCPRCGL